MDGRHTLIHLPQILDSAIIRGDFFFPQAGEVYSSVTGRVPDRMPSSLSLAIWTAIALFCFQDH